MKTVVKELFRWLIMTAIIGSIAWVVIKLCKFIKGKIKGS